MTAEQLRQAYLKAQERAEAHEARRDGKFHARPKAEWTLGDRVVADRFVPKGRRGIK